VSLSLIIKYEENMTKTPNCGFVEDALFAERMANEH
jgi:hypothetical protein